MAVPQNAIFTANIPHRSGIGLVVVPSSDPSCDVELWRKTATGSTSDYQLLVHLSAQQIGGQQYSYMDPLPVDNRSWDYIGRHTALDRAPSTFSVSLRRKAVSTPTIMPPIPQLTGAGMPGDVFISTGKKFKLGTKEVPSALTSTMYFPYSAINPLTSTHKLAYNFGELRPDSVFVPQEGQMGLPLPAGVVITQVAMLSRRPPSTYVSTTGDVVQGTFRQGTSTGGNSILATLTNQTTAGAYLVTSSTAMSVTAGANPFHFGLKICNISGSVGNHAAFAWLRVRYTRASYDVVY